MNNYNKIWKKIILCVIAVFIVSVIGLVLLCAVYSIPREQIRQHVIESENTIRLQNEDYKMQNGNYYETYDTDTNIIMLLEAIAPRRGTILEDALLCPSGDYLANQWGDWADTLVKYTQDIQGQETYVDYARYWHGYLVILKPLLLFMNLQEIYYLNAMVVVFLTGLIFILFYKRLGKYCIGYAIMTMTMNPIAIMQSFQLSTVFYAMQITLLLLFLCKKEDKAIYIFLLDGMIVAHMDFLTYPLVAYAIPFLTYYLLFKADSLRDSIKLFLKTGVSFLGGYAGLWFLKWLWATIFTNENILIDGWINVLRRTGTGDNFGDGQYGMPIGPMSAIKINLQAYVNISTILLGCIFIIIVLWFVVHQKRKIVISAKELIIPILVSSLPILWYVVLNNHASLHPHLEWREWIVTTYAWMVLVLGAVKNQEI